MFQYGQYAPQFSQRLKDCPMEAAAEFPIAHVLVTLQKEFPCATVTRFSTGIAFLKFVSCLLYVFCLVAFRFGTKENVCYIPH